MRNHFLNEKTTRDIDKQVAKVLRDLGNPKPPLCLEEVRRLLQLDLQFYSSTNDGALREVVHKLKIAGKQIIERPTLLLEAIKAWDLKALFLPDRKRILIDSSQPKIKWRWQEGHEINHSIIPWHGSLMLGDDKLTLTPSCHEQIEAEANYGNGRLLFLRDHFDKMAQEASPCFKSVEKLSKLFGNNLTNTLWRFVEQSEKPALGIVCAHPHHLPHDFDPADPCRYFIRSKGFCNRFPNVSEIEVFSILSSYCSFRKGGPLGSKEVILCDSNGNRHVFLFETFGNTYEILTLGVYIKQSTSIILI